MHDHPHDHHHRHHHHGHDHGDDGGWDAPARPAPGPGHNGGSAAFGLHSALRGAGGGRQGELQTLAAAFLDGFAKAEDKTSYLRLAGIPFTLPGPDGLSRCLVDVAILSEFQVATASPGFGSRELVHMPYPGSMVRERTRMTFTYVSLTGRQDVDLLALLEPRVPPAADAGAGPALP